MPGRCQLQDLHFFFNIKHQELLPLIHYWAFWVNPTRHPKYCVVVQKICVETHPVQSF